MGRKSRHGNFRVLWVTGALLVALAATGWAIYRHYHNKQKEQVYITTTTEAQSTTSVPPTATSTGQQTVAPTPATAATYVTIKEWGIRLPLSDVIKDAYYVVSTGSADENMQPNTVWIGLQRLDKAGCAAALGNTKGADAPLGAIGRVRPTDHDPVKGVPYTQLYPGTLINGYYYFYLSDTKDKTCADTATLQAIDAGFTAAAKEAMPSTDNQ